MQQPFGTAREVSEFLLERTGTALLEDKFDTFLSCIILPQQVETFAGQRLLTSPQEVHQVFRAVRAYHQKNGVTDIVRHCVEAAFKDPHTVAATHETRLLSGDIMTQDPYPGFSVLRFDGDTWRIASMSYAIEDRDDLNAALMSAGTTAP
ncbi:hypothetical protein [Roseobacter denitrificans]|uniref:SnoaL-like domain-containing protein n=1 Tax=Roseobacter denitrificans (strain ATCC 33942 / OCh 114) TaxID=375451 RepID=Q16AE2_ROSDO|nr:hypothetical protein [Roseobacter denitrificans]ABG31051.1 hypothetical protein RD1_1411 [Roseobacter denitrificans OCh 114]SFG33643.1 hypothetical protein SAMN05443635_113122 [Roseobacter denitrificans OCh 114]